MVKIALIDNGIKCDSKLNIKKRVDFSKHGSDNDASFYEARHGDICAAIINKYSSHCIFYDIKIYRDTLQSKVTSLIRALKWCLKNDVKVVNLSLGSVCYNDFAKLDHIMNQLNNEDIIVIAAMDNNNFFTMPASSTHAIGVVAGNNMKYDQYVWAPNSLIGNDIIASGQHEISLDGQTLMTPPYNSFAAPLITAKVCNIINNNRKVRLAEIKELLMVQAEKESELTQAINRNDDFPLFYTQREREIPIIHILGEIKMADYLRIKFCKAGYFAVLISDNRYNVSVGCESIPDGIKEDEYIDKIKYKYDCDLIILCSNNKTKIKVDISIQKNDNRIIINTEEKVICSYSQKRPLYFLYKKIESILS